MSHNYKILSFDATNGTMVIQFEDLQPLNFFVPNNGTSYLTGQELEDAIQALYPSHEVQRKEFVASLAGAEEIESLVEPQVLAPEDNTQMNVGKRLFLLLGCDWTQLPDSPLTEEKKSEWASYRQQLRDMSTQIGWPNDPIWPIAPTK